MRRTPGTKDIGELKTPIQSLEDDSSNQRRRAVVLFGFPYFLKEEPSKFIKICEPTDDEEVVEGMNVGLLVVTEENTANLLPKEIIDVAVVLEEEIVLDGLKDMSNAFAVLMRLLYALDIIYPKEVKYTFEVLQKVLMKIGGKACSARVHGIR
ncbi:unnamed protein product [Leuciscus chuanchicus]